MCYVVWDIANILTRNSSTSAVAVVIFSLDTPDWITHGVFCILGVWDGMHT